MASQITGIIPKQGFELVRDAIGVILLEELTAQKNRRTDLEDFEILSESLVPYTSAEKITINVLLAKADYGQMTQKDAQGRTIYFIDVVTSGEEKDDMTGSMDASFRRDRYTGMIGYIFRSAFYRYMGPIIPQGLVGGVYVESFTNLDPYKKEDSDFTTFARIQMAVRIQEDAQAWSGVELVGVNTSVRLDLTNKGYKFVFNS